MAGHRKLGRSTDQRMAILRGLVTDVLKYGRVETTLMRAKEARRIVDKMITLGKKGDLHARRQALSFVYDKNTVHRLFEEIAPRYMKRNGGYTRIYKLGPRRGDGAEMAILELVEYDAVEKSDDKSKKKGFGKGKKAAEDTKEVKETKAKKTSKKSVKEKAEEKVEELKDEVEVTKGEAKEAVKEAKEKVKEVAEEAKEKAEEVVEGLKEETEK